MQGGAPAIEARGLIKRFGDLTAVDHVSFSVAPGEIFGFLGPNGSGKTTTINMLTGLARPNAGTMRLLGVDCTERSARAQALMGVVPDESNLYPELSGIDNLSFCGALYGMPKKVRRARASELLETFGLAQAAKRKFGGYSKGMKRKLAIAAGIMHRPAILFLDEPTTGIDVASARQVRQSIEDLRRAGATIFLTTHYIEEAERLCDRIAFLVKGRIVRMDTVAELLKPVTGEHVLRITSAGLPGDAVDQLRAAFPGLSLSRPEPDGIQAASPDPIRVGPLVRFLEDNGAEVLEARRMLPSLEDVFVRVTGIEARNMRNGHAGSGSGSEWGNESGGGA